VGGGAPGNFTLSLGGEFSYGVGKILVHQGGLILMTGVESADEGEGGLAGKKEKI